MEYNQHIEATLSKPAEIYDHRKYTTDKEGRIRFDFLFSDWMIIWFVCYYFLPTKYTNKYPITRFFHQEFNPLLAFLLGAIENAFTLIMIIVYTRDAKMTLKYLIMMTFAKVLPIYLLWNRPFHWIHNIVVLIIIFGIYNIYLLANDTNMFHVYERTFTSILEDRDQTPIYSFAKSVISFF